MWQQGCGSVSYQWTKDISQYSLELSLPFTGKKECNNNETISLKKRNI
jgi:hypothetical protein